MGAQTKKSRCPTRNPAENESCERTDSELRERLASNTPSPDRATRDESLRNHRPFVHSYPPPPSKRFGSIERRFIVSTGADCGDSFHSCHRYGTGHKFGHRSIVQVAVDARSPAPDSPI